MRIEATVMSVSWIPSESVHGALRRGFDLGIAHFDEPPPPSLSDIHEVHELRDGDKFRFSNVLSGWIDVEDGRVVGAGHNDSSGLVMGSTTVRLAQLGATFRAISLPDIQREPAISDSSARFSQTVGGRTGVPLPRPVRHPPFMQWQAPVVWTTLTMTLHADGRSEVELAGASAFPRHWVYGPQGQLQFKSGVTDQATWVSHSFGVRTPWGEQDASAIVTAAESPLERELAGELMGASRKPEIRRLQAGATITRQGDYGKELFLVLDGVVGVDVDRERVAEVGPGAILGERAILEGGLRTATLVAKTPVRLAVASTDVIDLRRLQELSGQRQREQR